MTLSAAIKISHARPEVKAKISSRNLAYKIGV
jgi:hypothetical protein